MVEDFGGGAIRLEGEIAQFLHLAGLSAGAEDEEAGEEENTEGEEADESDEEVHHGRGDGCRGCSRSGGA